MEQFLKVAFLFSLLAFMGVFTFKIVLSKENSRIDIKEPEDSSVSLISSYAEPGVSEPSLEAANIVKESFTAELSSYETFPGEMVVLKVRNSEKAEAESSLLEGINLYPDGRGNLNALIPVKYDKEPGEYTIDVFDGKTEQTLIIKVKPKDFPKTDIEIDEETAGETIESRKANDEYNKRIQSLKWENEPLPMWQGKFCEPVENYRFTSPFGEIRTVNGKESGRHGGTDFAAPTGTKITAPAKGKVLFADFVALTGNTVMIEHGMGLKTLYYHMDSINVKAGDIVEVGDSLGTVGTTGFSTGPHLHFAVAVENIYVNPLSFFETDYRSYIDE